MKLYMVHCGFQDPNLFEGTFKTHINFLIAAEDFNSARSKAMQHPEFRGKKMEIDGLHEVEAVGGCRVFLAEDKTLSRKTIIHSVGSRDRSSKGMAQPQSKATQLVN